MANIKPIPTFVYGRAMELAPKGATLEQVQTKIVNDIKSELGRCNLELTKTGELSVAKFDKNLNTKVKESRAYSGKMQLESKYGAVGLYRFCLACASFLKEWPVARVELPGNFDGWLSSTLSSIGQRPNVDDSDTSASADLESITESTSA